MTQVVLQVEDKQLLPVIKKLFSSLGGVKIQSIVKTDEEDLWLAKQMKLSEKSGKGDIKKVKAFLGS